MNRKRLTMILAALALALLCGAATAEERLSIVATDFPCYDFARQALGEAGEHIATAVKAGYYWKE